MSKTGRPELTLRRRPTGWTLDYRRHPDAAYIQALTGSTEYPVPTTVQASPYQAFCAVVDRLSPDDQLAVRFARTGPAEARRFDRVFRPRAAQDHSRSAATQPYRTTVEAQRIARESR